MNRSAKYAVGIVIVTLALLTPLTLQAQDELTLESLAEQLVSLAERVTKLEEFSAKPELETTETGCILIRYHEDDVRYPGIKVPLIQDKTFMSYRKKFNRNLERLDIIRVDYDNQGSITIYYSDSDNDVVVAEVFAGCEFLDHTDWNPQ